MPSSSRYPLRQWIWRAFVQSALIPLILVESVLIAVYLLSNQAIRDAQIGHVQEEGQPSGVGFGVVDLQGGETIEKAVQHHLHHVETADPVEPGNLFGQT